MRGAFPLERRVKTALVVGSGAGGAAVAAELQGRYAVTVLEAGGPFTPLSMPVSAMERLRRGGLLQTPRLITLTFPAMRVASSDGIWVVTGRCLGGTTTLSTGNALRVDGALRGLGVSLDAEFDRLAQEIPITVAHRHVWRPLTVKLWDACKAEGLAPEPMPKAGDYARCRGCGRCVLGCPYGVKWDSRALLAVARRRGACVRTGWLVTRVDIRGGEARGVWARRGLVRTFFPADVVVLSAGGIGTPRILQRSGIRPSQRLFVDPVLCIAAPSPGSNQHAEIPMPFYTRHDGFILAPYVDYLSALFHRQWRHPLGGAVSIMIKLADSPSGAVHRRIEKRLSDADRDRLADAVEVCRGILQRLGLPRATHMRSLLTAGHPGGTVPLTEASARSLHPHSLPGNLFVADASLLPDSLGAPPILTITALALRVARLIDA